MPKLIILGEKSPIKEYELLPLNSLGRHPSQTIQVLDRLVSKEHAVIEVSETGTILRDLGSRNGSFVNNRLVTDEVPLNHGDKLLLGGTRMVYMDPAADSAHKQMTKVTIAPEFIQSAIAAKLSHEDLKDFQPETAIKDITVLRRDYEKLRMAYQLQQDIANEVDLDVLLQSIMDSLFVNLKCDRGAILLMNRDKGELETRCVKNRNPDAADEINISHTILDQVLKEKSAVLSSDASMDSRFQGAHSIIMQGIRSTMCVPLIAREDVLGVIHMDSLIATSAFTERDLGLVQGLATQAALSIQNSLLVLQREEDARVRERFSRLLSPNLVEQLVEGKVAIEKGGENRHSTVLFSDIRGFTAMSQRLDPSEIVAMLNEYFEIMVDIVFDHEGTLDKYMGDGMMAVFGSPLDLDDAEFKAVAAAVKMREALWEFNDTRRAEGLEPMHMGIGIDTGPLVAGYMGSTKTMNYTVIGPPVNMAARLCGVAKADEVLISDTTLAKIRSRAMTEALPPIELKGIGHAVIPYNVVSVTEPPVVDDSEE
ncbi:MAG: adenylate cyclase [Myxococcota bacterium]